MTDFSDIYETDNGMTLPDGVHVFARDAALGNVTILEDTVVMHRIEPTDALPETAVRQASIAVVEIDSANPASLARLEMLRSMRPDMPVIAGLAAAPVSMVRSLLRKGVSDVLELPFSSEELVAAIIDVARSSAPAPSPVKLAPVVAVLGTAGGTGATTVATQLAPLLSAHMEQGGRTALMDLSLQSGDAAAYLDVRPRTAINHLFDAIGRIDDDVIRSVAIQCEGDVDLLAAPEDIEPIESVPAETINRIITETRKRYSCVVLDMPSTLTNWAMPILLSADVVVLVGVGRISALRHVKRKLSLLQMLGRDRNSISIVLNKTEGGLFKRSDVSQMEEVLNHEVEQILDSDPALIDEAQLQGRHVSSLQKRSRLAKQFAELASSVSQKIEKDV